MSGVLVALGAAVAKTAFKVWTGVNPLADNVSDELTDLIAGKVSDAWDRQKVAHRFASIAEIVGDRVADTMSHEFRGLPEGERNAAVIAVTETLRRADLTDINNAARPVLTAGLDAATLERAVRRHTGQQTRDLSAAATSLYDIVLSQCCASIVEIADKLPSFHVDAFAALLRNDRQILERIAEVLERLPMPSLEAAGTDQVEVDYRRLIVKDFDKLQLFGLDFTSQMYPLSIAYVSLAMSARKPAIDNRYAYDPFANDSADGLDGREWSFNRWLDTCPRLLIEGRAGGGKTTILQWIAVRAALRDFKEEAAAYNDYVPFFLRLRSYVGRPLPRPEEFLDSAASVLAGEAGGWPNSQLRSGRAFVLVDGVDEIPEIQRLNVLAWLGQLTQVFPQARYVVTTRPGALEPDALADSGFVTADLEPMSPALVRDFVNRWHAAMRDSVQDTAAIAVLADCQANLLRTLADDRFLAELANTPLLAGLICALNHHLDGELPRRRSEIYAAAVKMFHERDRKRRVTSDLTLDLAASNHLLSDLAVWMVRNARSEVSGDATDYMVTADSARAKLSESSLSLRKRPSDDADLYKHLLLRSGVLREPTAGHVDFVHRTFQEYLAALALIRTDSVGEILGKAADSQWREIVILASGLGNTKQTSDLIRGLIRNRNWLGRQRYGNRLLAVACLNEIVDADPEMLDSIERAIPELLPPRDAAQAEALSHAGDRLIPYLAAASETCSEQDLPLVIHAASLTGGPEALRLLADLAVRPLPGRLRHRLGHPVPNAFMRAWSYFDPESYAESVIAALGVRDVTITDQRCLQGIGKAPTVERVQITGLRSDTLDISVLDGTQISQVTITQSSITSLTGRFDNRSRIKYLTLSSCPALEAINVPLPALQTLEIRDCAHFSTTSARYRSAADAISQNVPLIQVLMAQSPSIRELRLGPVSLESRNKQDKFPSYPYPIIAFIPKPLSPSMPFRPLRPAAGDDARCWLRSSGHRYGVRMIFPVLPCDRIRR